ncbi:MAG: type VI secretion system tube protein TssD [Limisphaerales bacterium]
MKKTLFLLSFVFLAATGASLQAAESIFLSIRDIRGEVVQKGREGWMEIYGFSHEIHSPRDAASGLPTGKRQHSPMRVVIRQSQATPLLLQAQSRNEVIPEVKVLFFRPSTITGAEQQYFTYTLKNARISSFRTWAPNKQDPAATPYLPSSELAFTYESITWTYIDGGVEHTDDWVTNQ